MCETGKKNTVKEVKIHIFQFALTNTNKNTKYFQKKQAPAELEDDATQKY